MSSVPQHPDLAVVQVGDASRSAVAERPARPQSSIAKDYGVSRVAIGHVLAGNTWRHVPKEEA